MSLKPHKRKDKYRNDFIPLKRELLIRMIQVRLSIDLPESHIHEVLNDIIGNYEAEISEYVATEQIREGLVEYAGKPGARTLQQWISKRLREWGACNNLR